MLVLMQLTLWFGIGYVLGRGVLRDRQVAGEVNPCPHGHLDWDGCPDCCH